MKEFLDSLTSEQRTNLMVFLRGQVEALRSMKKGLNMYDDLSVALWMLLWKLEDAETEKE